MSRYSRSQLYVDPKVQGALWRRLLWHWVIYNAVVCVLVLGLEWMNDPFRPISAVVSDTWWTYGPLLMVLACLIPVFIYDSIRFSHRFVGPVFRLRKVLHSLAQGENPGHVKFREKDFWKEIADDLNQVIGRLHDEPSATLEGDDTVKEEQLV
ncbi:hypothetical protein [Aeoliella mucimassa]|uniref:HAMP domain-containing protein n=1 Tax=Aeoliella mucimassa TaxID=2527972 RepID=A0A518AV67_9BACT|nr:hypothetical protein [Aeoliella mucimassa]QDU58603.1 hypothetical protein Pan181_48420 [Aeoliella mucimassa]